MFHGDILECRLYGVAVKDIPFHSCSPLLEFLGEAFIIRILILIIIIRAITHSSVFPSTLTGNRNVLIQKFNIFWIPA